MWAYIKELWKEVGDYVKKAFSAIGEELAKIFKDGNSNGIWAWLTEKYDWIIEHYTEFKDTVIGKVAGIVDSIVKWWEKNDFKSKLDGIIDKVAEIAKQVGDGLIQLAEVFGGVWDFVHDYISTSEKIGTILVDPKMAVKDEQALDELKRQNARASAGAGDALH